MTKYQELLSSDYDAELYKDKEIEVELSKYTSLLYSQQDDSFYIWTLDLNDEEEYRILIDENKLENIKGYDYMVTIDDIKQFIVFVNNLKKENADG